MGQFCILPHMCIVQTLYPVLTTPDPRMGFLGLCSHSFLLGAVEMVLRKDLTEASSLVHGEVNPCWRELWTSQWLAVLSH